MMSFPARGSVTRSLSLLVGLGLALQPVTAQTRSSEHRRIDLKQVFEFKPKPWRDWPWAILSPKADQIFYFSGPNLQVIDIATRRVVAKADYSGLPCPGTKEFKAWEILPDQPRILANYCERLLLIDAHSLKVLMQFDRLTAQYLGGPVLSADGRRAAVIPFWSKEGGFEGRLVFLDTQTWKEEQSRPMDVMSMGAFNEDWKLVVLRKGPGLRDKEPWCGLEVREMSTGALYSLWRVLAQNSPDSPIFVPRDPGCPHNPVFVPGHKGQIAAHLPMSIVIWDFEKRQIIREFKSERPVGQFLISPDGTFVIAEVANDPQDTPEYNQDFIIWDIDSGSVLYESPKVKWSFFDRFLTRGALLKGDVELSGFSADGKYLLVTRHKRLTLYEVVVSNGSKKETGGRQRKRLKGFEGAPRRRSCAWGF